MGINNKLIQWGWIDAKGRSLTWHYWQTKSHRQAVAYWREETGKVTPIFNVLAGYKVQKGKAA